MVFVACSQILLAKLADRLLDREETGEGVWFLMTSALRGPSTTSVQPVPLVVLDTCNVRFSTCLQEWEVRPSTFELVLISHSRLSMTFLQAQGISVAANP